MTLSPELRNFILKSAIKKTACHTFGMNELTFYMTTLGVEYIIKNESTWNLLKTQNSTSEWELEISRVLNENLREARLAKLQQEQRERDEFWRQRDAERNRDRAQSDY